ncbi:MAG: SDR family NAD(P)-dependent oxidoreductase, partial [Pseudomonadota bacterium]|nr:SDR family NAD(P)-dependent oxidoreductase [Pseudomonadota bacterium]
MDRLKNKVAIVTGGASNPGLGHSTIHKFADEGAKIVVTDIDVEGGKKTVEEVKEKGAEAIFIEQDVVSAKDWKNVIETSIQEFKKIDILVNNAGIALIAPFEDFAEEDWDKQIDVNLKSVFLGCKA